MLPLCPLTLVFVPIKPSWIAGVKLSGLSVRKKAIKCMFLNMSPSSTLINSIVEFIHTLSNPPKGLNQPPRQKAYYFQLEPNRSYLLAALTLLWVKSIFMVMVQIFEAAPAGFPAVEEQLQVSHCP